MARVSVELLASDIPCDSGTRYLPKSGFQRELQERVDGYFTASGRSKRGDARMYFKTAVMLGWLCTSYLVLLFAVTSAWAAVAAAISLGLAMAGVGFNVQHDGGHGSYSTRPGVNRVMALTLDLLGGTAYFWHYKHNVAHHGHPNVDGHDEDLDVGVLGRFAPYQRWRPHHRFQQLYVWLLYALLAVEWQITGEFRNFFGRRAYGQVRVPPLRGRERAIFWGGKLLFFALAFGLPMALHPVLRVLGLYAVASATLGLVLAVVFQLAHCSGQADFRQVTAAAPVLPRGWAEHQVESTIDFARGNRLLGWYLGGLNLQIEHHLFPKVCHIHYPALAPIVEDTCRRHGVRYTHHRTFLTALREHVRWLGLLGRRPVPVGQR